MKYGHGVARFRAGAVKVFAAIQFSYRPCPPCRQVENVNHLVQVDNTNSAINSVPKIYPSMSPARLPQIAPEIRGYLRIRFIPKQSQCHHIHDRSLVSAMSW